LCGCSHFLQANNCVMNSVTSNHFVLFFPVYSLLTLTRLVAAIQINPYRTNVENRVSS